MVTASAASSSSCAGGGGGNGFGAQCLPAAAELPRVQREPLKKRRGLSAFYASKSQSFSCIQELVSNPWSRSTLSLAKRRPTWPRAGSPPPPSSRCIDEDGATDSSSSDAAFELQLLAPAAAAPGSRRSSLERRSWDASDSASSSSSSSACSALCGPAVAALQAQQLLLLAPWGQPQQAAAGPMRLDGGAPCSDASAALCVALQSASLAAPLAGFGLAGLRSYDACSSMVVVGADDGC